MDLTFTHAALALAALVGLALIVVGWRGGIRRRRAAPNRIAFALGMLALTDIWLMQPRFASPSPDALPDDVGLWTIDQLVAFEVSDDDYRLDRGGPLFMRTASMLEILRRVRDRLVEDDDVSTLAELWRQASPNSRVRHESIGDWGRSAPLGLLLLDDDRLSATDRRTILAPLLESTIRIAGQETPGRIRLGRPVWIRVVADGTFRLGAGLVGGGVASWSRSIAVVAVRDENEERVPFMTGLHWTDSRDTEFRRDPSAFNVMTPNRLTIEFDRLPEGDHRFVAEIDEWVAPDDLWTRHHSPRGGDTPPAEIVSRRHRLEFGVEIVRRGARIDESAGDS